MLNLQGSKEFRQSQLKAMILSCSSHILLKHIQLYGYVLSLPAYIT